MENSISISDQFFISAEGNCEEFVMHSKRDKIETIINDKVDEVIEKLFESLLNRCLTVSKSSFATQRTISIINRNSFKK